MKRQLTITSDPIEETRLVSTRPPFTSMGAVVTFTGVVRDREAGQPIAGLEYESFEKMARHQFELLFETMAKRWPVASVRLVHRVGTVKAGETSLWLEIIAPHRGEAFAAGQWLIDEMKQVVPIWKRAV